MQGDSEGLGVAGAVWEGDRAAPVPRKATVELPVQFEAGDCHVASRCPRRREAGDDDPAVGLDRQGFAPAPRAAGEGDRRPAIAREGWIELAGPHESRHEQLVAVGRLRGEAGDDDLAVSLNRHVCGRVVAVSPGEIERPRAVHREAAVEASGRLEAGHGDIGLEH